MNKMKYIIQDPNAMQEWFEGKRKEFNSLPDTKKMKEHTLNQSDRENAV